MLKLVGLRQDALDLIGAAKPTLLSMLVGEHNRIFLNKWTLNLPHPDTGVVEKVEAQEVPDKYVEWNGHFYLFTSLMLNFTSHKQPVYEWSHSITGAWMDKKRGVLWLPPAAKALVLPKVDPPIQIFVNIGLTDATKAWLASVPETKSLEPTEQFEIPNVEGHIPLVRYSGKLPSEPVTIQEYVKYAVRVDGNYYVFLGLHIANTTTDYTWTNGSESQMFDVTRGRVDLTQGESLTLDPKWIVPIAPKTPPGFVEVPKLPKV